jgi:hypothetical protein
MPTNFPITIPTTPVDSAGKTLNKEWRSQIVTIQTAITSLYQYGTTAQRPTTVAGIGQMYFDTILTKPIWVKSLNPIVWVDATGSTV